MNDFGVKSEGEIVSGQVHSFGRHHMLRAQKDHKALLLRLNRETNELRTEFREFFWNGADGKITTTEATQKACAWWKVCDRQMKQDRSEGKLAILSFPWCVSDVLCDLISPKVPFVGDWMRC